jgi:hypothetical protein
VLGFLPQFVPAAPTLVVVEQLADNQAAFNNIEYFKIHADIGEGIRTNHSFDQTIARVNITAAPGSQIVHSPQNPPESEMHRWIGSSRNSIIFWLTDQANNLVSTGEIWSVRLLFQYHQFVLPPLRTGQQALKINLPSRQNRRHGT